MIFSLVMYITYFLVLRDSKKTHHFCFIVFLLFSQWINYHHQYFSESSLRTLSFATKLNVVALTVQEQCFDEYSIKRQKNRKKLQLR